MAISNNVLLTFFWYAFIWGLVNLKTKQKIVLVYKINRFYKTHLYEYTKILFIVTPLHTHKWFFFASYKKFAKSLYIFKIWKKKKILKFKYRKNLYILFLVKFFWSMCVFIYVFFILSETGQKCYFMVAQLLKNSLQITKTQFFWILKQKF